MEKINYACEELIKALKESEIYNEYKEAERELSSEDRVKINALKHHREMAIKNSSWDDRMSAEELYRILMLSPSARKYILSEKKILRIISDMYDKIGQIM